MLAPIFQMHAAWSVTNNYAKVVQEVVATVSPAIQENFWSTPPAWAASATAPLALGPRKTSAKPVGIPPFTS